MERPNKPYILIVDDNPDNLLAMQAILKDFAANLILASSGMEALRYILRYDFAVILMDAQMPGMDGFETARLIRSRDKSLYTPIIFASALRQDETDIDKGYSLGAVDYIFKPINANILYAKVKVFVDLFTKSVHALALQQELKKRIAIERELKLLSRRTQLILESAGEGIFGVSSKGIITFVNQAAANLFAMDKALLVGQSVVLILESGSVKTKWQDTPIYQALKNGCSYHIENAAFCNLQGDLIPVDYTVAPKQNPQGKHQGVVVIFRDISERRRAEQQALQHEHQLKLAQTSRIVTIEEMASALAHELNQPLAAISNYVKGCTRRLEKGNYEHEELVSSLQKAAQQAERAGAIIHRIKNFVRKEKLFYQRIDSNELIKTVADMINIPQHIKLRLQLDQALPMVMADRIQLEQVMDNLIRNSLEAMQEIPDKKHILLIQTSITDNKYITIDVMDTGPGFDPEHANKLFDLYFTTKGTGMGIGLSICRTIIESHGGRLIAKLNPKGGAWLQFTLNIDQQ